MKNIGNKLITGYRHTGIIVRDMKESLHFYHEILGLSIVQNCKEKSDYINRVLGLDDVELKIVKLSTDTGIIVELLEYVNHPSKVSELPFYNIGNCHIAFEVLNADQIFKRLESEKIEIISPPELSSEKFAKVFFCVDPNNVRIELVEILKK